MKSVHAATMLVAALFFSLFSFAGTVKGHISDKKTGEPITGAVVSAGPGYNAVSGLDGSYIIKNISAGDYELTVTNVGYETATRKISVTANEATTADFILDNHYKALETLVVSGRTAGAGNTDASARQIEKLSDNVLNILSSRTIQLAPDVTVANILRRVSGVTVDRGDDGEGRYPVIRGMDKRYNYTLVNGIKIPSPDDKNRYVPMDIFPSEMLQRLEVVKTLTPDMEGDAIGGVMNLVMKEAPGHLVANAQAAIGYSQMLFNTNFSSFQHASANSQSPFEQGNNAPKYSDFSKGALSFSSKKAAPNGQLGFTIGDRIANRKLGFIFSGSWQSTDRISKETFFLFSPQPTPQTNASIAEYTDAQLRTYSTHEDRLGLHGKLDYQFNKNNSISFYSIFMELNNFRARFYTDSSSSGRKAPGQGLVKYSQYSRSNFQTIYNGTLQGKHVIVPEHLQLDWSGVYSIAKQKTPDRSELITSQNFVADANGQVATPPTYFSSLTRFWQHNSDKDLAAYINFHYKFLAGDQKLDLGVGGMTRQKERDNFYNAYSFTPSTFPVQPYTDLNNLSVSPDKGTPQSPNIYSATENISAGYGELRWIPDSKWNILGGVRIEHTSQHYNQTAVPDNTLTDGKTGTSAYDDVLPSLHIKYSLSKKAALHASYFKAISRPGFFEVVPYQFPGDYYTEVGNYNLHHITSDNFDLRYELFPGLADQFFIGAFYKKIYNPIEYVYDRPATSNSVIKPANIGTATNAGGEIVFTKMLNRFGVSANYTYTHSKVSASDKFYYRDGAGNVTTTTVIVNRPLQGQAEHTGNISLLYKDAKHGSEAQLAAIYTGRHIVYASPYYGKDDANAGGSGLDYWQRGNVVLDFSGEQKISKHFAFYFKVNNLINTKDIIELMHSSSTLTQYPPFQNRADRILVSRKTFGQIYLAGIRYHL